MPDLATRSRSARSCADQPVVPITTFMPRSASSGRLRGTASATVKSIATSTLAEVVLAQRRLGLAPARDGGDQRAVLRRQRLDQLPHPPVADQEEAHHARPAGAGSPPNRADDARSGPGSAAKNCPCSCLSACGRSASRITNVTLRRDAACDTSRIGTSPTPCSTWPIKRGIGLQPVADDADDRHVVLGVDLARTPTALRQSPAAAADRRP